MEGYQTVDEVIGNYMGYQPVSDPQREKLIQAYYRNIKRSADPCWKSIISEKYRIVDHCDVFVNGCKEGTLLALYSSVSTLEGDGLVVKANYPVQNLNVTGFNFFGLKMNILAYLSPYNINKLTLYYNDNYSQDFTIKEIIATTVLDHYANHFMPKDKEQPEPKEEKPDPVMEQIKLQLF